MFHSPTYPPYYQQQPFFDLYSSNIGFDQNLPTHQQQYDYVKNISSSMSSHHKQKQHHRRHSKSFSRLNTLYNDEYCEEGYQQYSGYYSNSENDPHYYNNNYQQQHQQSSNFGSRSTTPLSDNSRHHYRNSTTRRQQEMQSTPFVQHIYPMTMNPMKTNQYYCQEGGLDNCATTNTRFPSMTNTGQQPFFMNDLLLQATEPMMIQQQQPISNNSFPASLVASYYSSLSNQPYHLVPPTMPGLMPPNLYSELMLSTAVGLDNCAVNLPSITTGDNNQQLLAAPILASQPVTPPPTSEPTTADVRSFASATAPQAQQKIIILPPLRRKKSFMEVVLSTLSLLGDDHYNSHGIYHHYPNQSNHSVTVTNNEMESSGLTSSPSSPTIEQRDINNGSNSSNQSITNYYSSSASARKSFSPPKKKDNRQDENGLSRSPSLKLFQKANAPQNRPYIWCYRPFLQKKKKAASPDDQAPFWTAFDVRNQIKLDNQYAFITTKKDAAPQQVAVTEGLKQPQQQVAMLKITDDPSLIITLDKQSNIDGPVRVSIKDGLAWYYTAVQQATINNDKQVAYELLEITCLPTHYNRLFVLNDLLEEKKQKQPLKRAKSMDGGFTSRVLNTILSR